MATQVLMPQLGEGIEEATITKWLKSEGEAIEEFEALVEINTDKVDTEIPAPVAGTLLKIEQPEEGSIVQAGMILAWIGQPGESVPAGSSASLEVPTPETSEGAPAPDLTASPPLPAPTTAQSRMLESAASRDLGFISPVVAKIAAEHGINLQNVPGTGLNGRITKKDVLATIQTGQQAPSSPRQTESRPQPETSGGGNLIPHTVIRQRIAEHMVLSKHTSPHVTTVFEADMSKVVTHREAHKSQFARDGVKLTFTAYFVAATAQALRAHPLVNASWSDAGIILHPEINIGMATSLGKEGLIVPVIKKAGELSLLGISRSVNDLANRARSKQLQPEEVSGGTFTITNHGVSGSLFAMPIINQPQCAILGVGKLQKRVVVLADETGYDTIAVRPMVYLTLTFDHRVLDGAMADYFLNEVVQTLENWT